MGNIRDINFQPGLIISSVNFDLITKECCLSNADQKVFMQVQGPINGDGDDIVTE